MFRVNPSLHAHNAFYSEFSTGRHGFAGRYTSQCALIHPQSAYSLNRFVHRLWRLPSPPRNTFEQDFTFQTFPFNETESHFILYHGDHLDASRRSPPLCYGRANCMTLNRIRDNSVNHTLSDTLDSSPTGLTTEDCINHCDQIAKSYAGVENGIDCCECTSRSCGVACRASASFAFRDFVSCFVVLITHFGMPDCGNSLAQGAKEAFDCNVKCAGDSSETCGGTSSIFIHYHHG